MANSIKLANKRQFWLIILLLTAFTAPICSAQNTLKPKKKQAVVKKITNIFNSNVVKSIRYFDTIGILVLEESEGAWTYNTHEKETNLITLSLKRNQLTVSKSIKGDSNLRFLENKFETDTIGPLKTCFYKLSGDSLINYLNKIDLNKLFKNEDLKTTSYAQFFKDTTNETIFIDGDTSYFVKYYPLNDSCEVEKKINKKGEQIWVKYKLYNKRGKVTDEIFINGENDTSYHFRHYYKNNLRDESYFVGKGQEELFKKRYYKNGKLVKLENYIGGGDIREETYHYNAAGNLIKVMIFANNTIDHYEYY